MRILQILGGAGDKYGSMERFIVELCDQAAQKSFIVDVIMVNTPSPRFHDNLRTHVENLICIPCGGPYDLGFWSQVYNVTSHIRPDIVHTHYDRVNLLGPFVMKICGVDHVFQYFHNSFTDSNKVKKRLYFFIAKHLVTSVYCVSKQIGGQLIEFGVPSSLIKTQLLGLDLTTYKRRQQIDFQDAKERPLRILTVADARPEKGLDILILAFLQVKRQMQNAHLHIIGDGPLLAHARILVESCGIQDSVDFLGRRDDVPDLLSQSDLYIQPSLSEGLPLAVMEAMATGLPIIASDVGGVSELLEDRVSGLLILPGCIDCLAAAIVELINDVALRESLGRNAYEKSRNFDSRKSVQMLLDHYSNVCKNA